MTAMVDARLGSQVEDAEAHHTTADDPTDWEALSRDLGGAVQDELVELGERVEEIELVFFCTADGLNLCTLGADHRDVGRVSALTSSIFSVAAALRKAAHADAHGLTVHLSDEGASTVFVPVELPGTGSFILGAHAIDVPHAVLLVETRRMAQRIATKLSPSGR
jgi:hypothetical protein